MNLDREEYQPFMKINFHATGIVTQELTVIDDELTPEQIVRGLNSGEYLTTMNYEAGGGAVSSVVKFDDQDNEVEIATIMSQEVFDNGGNYSSFVLLESSDD